MEELQQRQLLNVSAEEMLNSTVMEVSEELCPGLTDWENKFIAYLGYYVEGVLILVTSIIGITINLVSSIIILTRSEMRNCFNILLVALAGFDTWYLFGAILEACRKYFPALRSDNAIYLFPYFLYPAHQTSIAGSIFMTVAIAFERYAAVHYPLDYNQAMNDNRLMKRRICKYLIPVSLLSLIINIPKFFESKVEYTNNTSDFSGFDYDDDVAVMSLLNGTKENVTSRNMVPYIGLSEMRTHPMYSLYNSWSRFAILGVTPFCLLVFFNTKIYKDIKERKRRRQLNAIIRPSTKSLRAREDGDQIVPMIQIKVTAEIAEPNIRRSDNVVPEIRVEEPTTIVGGAPSLSEGTSSGHSTRSLKKTNCSIKKARKQHCFEKKDKSKSQPWVSFWPSSTRHLEKKELEIPEGDKEESLVETPSAGSVSPATLNEGGGNSSTQKRQKKKDIRRKNEDSLAVVFMIIIFIFLICHSPRIILDIHELMTIKQSEYCNEINEFYYSSWSVILLSVSHFLLVVNSSVNMIVYCLLGSRFRKEIRKMFDTFKCWINPPNNNIPY